MAMSIEMTQASMSMADVDMNTMVAAKKTFSRKSFWDTVSYAVATCAGVTAILAMALTGSTLTYVAMSISLLLSSAATVQRFKLSRQESRFSWRCDILYNFIMPFSSLSLFLLAFREIHNHVRGEVNRLQLENNNLTLQVDNLKSQSAKLSAVEGQLESLLRSQNTQTNTFLYEVKQNKIVQDEIQKLLVIEVMQNIISTVMKADCDQDFLIDPEEVDVLILRVKALPGVEKVDEARLKGTLLKKGSGLEAVLKVVQDLMNDDTLVQVSTRGLVLPQQ
jgi:hypothetical protein